MSTGSRSVVANLDSTSATTLTPETFVAFVLEFACHAAAQEISVGCPTLRRPSPMPLRPKTPATGHKRHACDLLLRTSPRSANHLRNQLPPLRPQLKPDNGKHPFTEPTETSSTSFLRTPLLTSQK